MRIALAFHSSIARTIIFAAAGLAAVGRAFWFYGGSTGWRLVLAALFLLGVALTAIGWTLGPGWLAAAGLVSGPGVVTTVLIGRWINYQGPLPSTIPMPRGVQLLEAATDWLVFLGFGCKPTRFTKER